MGEENGNNGSGINQKREPAIRFLVESALRSVLSKSQSDKPRSREEWVAYLAEAMISDSETSHHAAISSLVASGVSSEEVFQKYIPAVSRFLGEMWVSDKASFVDVTVGAARLQALFRNKAQPGEAGWLTRSIPLGQSVLMIVPNFENHSLGAFVAADQFRRHGLWVHMAIGLEDEEIAALIETSGFSLLGITAATPKSVEKCRKIVEYLKTKVEHCPPIAIGGFAVEDAEAVERTTGADFAVKSVREAVERAELSTVAGSALLDA
ncbi:MAG TPA: cobalamin B12-binding domain-containing protein [Roseovarius sp.]|nr:cobalamin B12-binding domain-containing protein [Roseovarius sp.]